MGIIKQLFTFLTKMKQNIQAIRKAFLYFNRYTNIYQLYMFLRNCYCTNYK